MGCTGTLGMDSLCGTASSSAHVPALRKAEQSLGKGLGGGWAQSRL